MFDWCQDLVARMEPVIMELERKETVVVVGHQAVLRFFNNIKIWSPITLTWALLTLTPISKSSWVTKQFSGSITSLQPLPLFS